MRLRFAVHDRLGWLPLLAGSLAAIVVWAIVLAGGVAASLWLIPWHDYRQGDYRDIGSAALWWLCVVSWMAFTVGGWMAARMLIGSRRDAAVAGALVGTILLLLFCVLLAVVGDAYADIRSVEVELGMVEIPEDAIIVEPVSDQFEDPTIRTSDDVRATVIAAAATLAALVPLLLGGAILGGLAGHRGSGQEAAGGRAG